MLFCPYLFSVALESRLVAARPCIHVHCRIGSLENFDRDGDLEELVHCRIGSLENEALLKFEWVSCGHFDQP